MTISTMGNQRSDYTHWEDTKISRAVMFNSSDGTPLNKRERHSDYRITMPPISCTPNQVIECYLQSADIPMTTYQINKYNNTIYILIRDWLHEAPSNDGIFNIRLTTKNYTRTELRQELENKLNALTDTAVFNLDTATYKGTGVDAVDFVNKHRFVRTNNTPSVGNFPQPFDYDLSSSALVTMNTNAARYPPVAQVRNLLSVGTPGQVTTIAAILSC